MKVFNTETADEAWVQVAQRFFNRKSVSQTESRLGLTFEMLHVGFTINNPREHWVISRFPPINPAFALAEIVWIINGSRDASFINHWNPILPKYSGYTGEYHGAYGYRLINHFGFDQLDRAYQALLNNSESRQVVLQIWDPKIDFPDQYGKPVSHDIPCNICAFLKVRNKKLEWCQIMRSNDLFRGLPYNFVQFTTLQEILAGWLGIDIGTYNHLSDSLHLYEEDLGKLSIQKETEVLANSDSLSLPYDDSITSFQQLFRKMQRMVSNKISSQEFEGIFNPPFKNEAIQNILLIVGADIARRRKWFKISERMVGSCSNLLYRKLWNNWMNSRMSKRRL